MNINGKLYNDIAFGGDYSSIRLADNYSMNNMYGLTPTNGPIDEYNFDCGDDKDIEVFKYNDSWNNDGCIDKCPTDKFPDLTKYHDEIIQYIKSTSEVRCRLSMGKTIRIGIISKPGMGKSTLIRMLATTLKKDVYIATDIDLDEDEYRSVEGIIVVEDYDRYCNVIRIPHEVDCISIVVYTSNTYLNNVHELDMVFTFEGHPYDTYNRSVNIVFPEGREDITQLLFNSQISMREANILLVNSISLDNPYEYIKDNTGKIVLNNNSLKLTEEYDDEDFWL